MRTNHRFVLLNHKKKAPLKIKRGFLFGVLNLIYAASFFLSFLDAEDTTLISK